MLAVQRITRLSLLEFLSVMAAPRPKGRASGAGRGWRRHEREAATRRAGPWVGMFSRRRELCRATANSDRSDTPERESARATLVQREQQQHISLSLYAYSSLCRRNETSAPPRSTSAAGPACCSCSVSCTTRCSFAPKRHSRKVVPARRQCYRHRVSSAVGHRHALERCLRNVPVTCARFIEFSVE